MMKIRISDGTILSVYDQGKGEPVFMLHGNLQRSNAFDNQIEHLKNSYRLISIDTRGHGSSDHGDKKLSYKLLAKDILDVADYLDIYTFNILGYSDGANIAINTANISPSRVQSMILISPNFSPIGIKLRFRLLLKIILLLLTPLQWIKYMAKLKDILNLMNSSYEVKKDNFIMPILIITGSRDIIHKHHIEELADKFSHATISIIPKCGHNTIKSDEINGRIEEFLSSN